MRRCDVCNRSLVGASGPKDAKILIIGEFPNESEIMSGRPFTGSAGKVLKNEMKLAGMEFAMCRVANIWQHEPSKIEECYKLGLDAVLDEAKDREAILLLGSECSNAFIGKSVMEIAGMLVTSPLLNAKTIVACPNPAIVFHPNQGVGEVRLSINKFAKYCRERGIE